MTAPAHASASATAAFCDGARVRWSSYYAWRFS
jgi:hypothetical protein